MKRSHLAALLFGAVVMSVVAVAAGTGVLLQPLDGDASTGSGVEPQSNDPGSMSVDEVTVRNQTADGVVYLDVGIAGDLEREALGRSLEGLYGDRTTNVSSIDLLDVRTDAVTVAIATDGRSNSAEVADRAEHHLDDVGGNESPDGTEPDETQSDGPADESDDDDAAAGGDSTSESGADTENDATQSADSSGSAAESTPEQCALETVFYQLDFVEGEPIENLRGPKGTYTPDDLIRFAHGSTEEPLVRSSDGEFTTNESLRQAVESQAITVEDGVAEITFSIAAGAEPVELTLASYEKPGRFWSPETESEQEFIDADTETFGPGGPYTLHVALPEADVGPCETETDETKERQELEDTTDQRDAPLDTPDTAEPEDTPENIPEDTPENTPEDTPENTPEDTTTETAADTTEGTTANQRAGISFVILCTEGVKVRASHCGA